MADNTPSEATLDHTEPHRPRISRLEVKNFRLLRDVTVRLDEQVTVCVGRNNTGKTSLADALGKMLRSGEPSLRIEDFSTESHGEFLGAFQKFDVGDEAAAREILPEITVRVLITYDPKTPSYGPLGPLIVDLDPDCNEAVIHIKYALKPGRLKEFFRGVRDSLVPGDEQALLLDLVGPRIPYDFERTAWAVDPTDVDNVRQVALSDVAKAVHIDFVKAQRGLDDEKERPKDQLGKVLESLFVMASQADDGSFLKLLSEEMDDALGIVAKELTQRVQDTYDEMAPTVAEFGYPGLGNRNITARTTLDARRLMSNFTSIRYPGTSGVELPESYTGLGHRNLLMILLTLFVYYRTYDTQQSPDAAHLVFLEEPEAHLHPQMQEVFIHQLGVFKAKFPHTKGSRNPWNVQFVVTTHSAHIANKAGFPSIRYFRACTDGDPTEATSSTVLSLADAPGIDTDFLHKYLTLTRADLFFADKAILVEGTTERIFVPAAVAEFDRLRKACGLEKLSAQYISIVEVGGNYAHLFYPFVDFLGLRTLVITDMDSVSANPATGKLQKCCVHEGTKTSNQGIKVWLDGEDTSPTSLLKRAGDGLPTVGCRALAYQVPELPDGPCGRTFEDAFILANPELFPLDAAAAVGVVAAEAAAMEEAAGHKKSNFALHIAVETGGWHIPRYIHRGLEWLVDRPSTATVDLLPAGEAFLSASAEREVG
ncbi:ATP-dependent nuclease [Yinghuangia sp. YIM S10712]|uniref:ATP-dependent nuclease n=1 Tax=Yinghuangia sp. YIM S10712 TaxID=3436930 RepID=UPI003F52ED00